jgi:hypothetical protein
LVSTDGHHSHTSLDNHFIGVFTFVLKQKWEHFAFSDSNFMWPDTKLLQHAFFCTVQLFVSLSMILMLLTRFILSQARVRILIETLGLPNSFCRLFISFTEPDFVQSAMLALSLDITWLFNILLCLDICTIYLRANSLIASFWIGSCLIFTNVFSFLIVFHFTMKLT